MNSKDEMAAEKMYEQIANHRLALPPTSPETSAEYYEYLAERCSEMAQTIRDENL